MMGLSMLAALKAVFSQIMSNGCVWCNENTLMMVGVVLVCPYCDGFGGKAFMVCCYR